MLVNKQDGTAVMLGKGPDGSPVQLGAPFKFNTSANGVPIPPASGAADTPAPASQVAASSLPQSAPAPLMSPGADVGLQSRLAGEKKRAALAAQHKEEARQNMLKSKHARDHTIKIIDNLLEHPAFNSMIGMPEGKGGWLNYITGKALPGSPEAGFKVALGQLAGNEFMMAYEGLKGSGQITEFESKTASQAISRLQGTAQSEADWRKAAAEFKEVINKLYQRAENAAKSASSSRSTIYPDKAVDYLKQNDTPDVRKQFDEKFGAGAAAKALAGG